MAPLDPIAARTKSGRRVARASIVLVLSLFYLGYVFRLFDARSWNFGLGDWIDPYFINALLEHWYRSATNLLDPSSPAMFFPIRKTLGYSHGLVLFAPFYVALRVFLHPFHAYTWTLVLVIETGILCLYLLLRKLSLSFFEALLISALYLSSRNVVNGWMGVWSQRVSVFLIPPILLLFAVFARMRSGRARLLLAGLAAFLSTLLYAQDFPTAHLALLLGTILGAAVAFVDGGLGQALVTFGKSHSRAFWVSLTVIALAGAWACFVLIFGGVDLRILGARLRSESWRRPALIALFALLALIVLSVRTRAGAQIPRRNPWLVALGIGAAAGALVFLWMYLPAYREHRSFSEEDLISSFQARNPSRWRSPLDFLRDLGAYESLRFFAVAFVVGALAWIPGFRTEKRTRIYCLWFLAISVVVLLIPLRFPEFSIWRAFFQWLPGFGAIRDPKRIISLYELAAALAVGLFVARLPAKSARRISIAVFLLVLLIVERNREVFHYERPIEAYERWVGAPIAIDPACRSFFIKGASEKYMARSGHKWSLYGIDSFFVAMNHGIPTLNGYSAWYPAGWDLLNPQEVDYPDRVKRWIDAHGLTGVCELDIDARTMTPRVP